jgi:hypothetical protein
MMDASYREGRLSFQTLLPPAPASFPIQLHVLGPRWLAIAFASVAVSTSSLVAGVEGDMFCVNRSHSSSNWCPYLARPALMMAVCIQMQSGTPDQHDRIVPTPVSLAL